MTFHPRLPAVAPASRHRSIWREVPLALTFTAILFFLLAAPAPAAAQAPSPAQLVDLGRALFFDADLSRPRGTSCASCHDPEAAFGGTHGSRVGLPLGSRPGRFARRTSPSLLYLRYVPRFRYFQEGDDPEGEPFGGLFWDGRADTITDLARLPLLNPNEMNNRDGRSVADTIAAARYGPAFRRAFGTALADPEATLHAVGQALEAFLTTDDMAPFSSRFDDYVRGRAELTPLEAWGLRLFKDPGKGNCAACHHFDDSPRGGGLSLFTDFGYEALGVPKNRRVARARQPDLGLCERTDTASPSNDGRYCANFRTPSLRNVAIRASFMHNGAFSRLRDVVAFYATRATDPRRWYPSGVSFDDLPVRYRGQVNTSSPPYNRRAGDPPALDDREIDAVVAFLQTLTDARYAHRPDQSAVARTAGERTAGPPALRTPRRRRPARTRRPETASAARR
jgi:cytochrome c peroxidase